MSMIHTFGHHPPKGHPAEQIDAYCMPMHRYRDLIFIKLILITAFIILV